MQALCETTMKLNTLILSIVLSFSPSVGSEESFKYLGTFDNVKSTNTGHCYGASVSIWDLGDKNIIGLLNIDMGLCGDPLCSILNGTIDNNKIKFKTSVPIYNELYVFDGYIAKKELSGSLNGSNSTLNQRSFNLSYKNIKEWCSMWSKISRCGGVKEYCK